MEITLDAITRAARHRLAAITAEGAGYLVLLVVQQMGTAPRRISASVVRLGEAGEVGLAHAEPSTVEQAEADCRTLLAALSIPRDPRMRHCDRQRIRRILTRQCRHRQLWPARWQHGRS